MEQFLIKQLCLLNAKCPCGGEFNDFHSHASDCVVIGGDKEYSWDADRETPSQRNSKRRHAIKGHLSPLYNLPIMIEMEQGYVDEPSKQASIQDIILREVDNCERVKPLILELLDNME